MDNPIRISAQEIPEEDLVVSMDAGYGKVLKRKKGLYFVHPEKTGNVELKVLRKHKDGTLQLLNSRFFRIAPCMSEDAGSMIFSKS